MLFTNNPKSNLTALILNREEIKITHEIKFLGVIYDSKMNFKSHISKLSLKLSRNNGMLYQVKKLAPTNVLRCLNPIWATTYPTNLTNLVILQKKMVRLMTRSDYLAHTPPLFKDTNILRLNDITFIYIASHCYKERQTINIHANPLHNYPTRHHLQLLPPPHRLTIFEHSYTYQRIHIWNEIPDYIKSSSSFDMFKSKLKQYLLSKY